MVDINNDFAYPNADSYRSMGRGNGPALHHGVVYSMEIAAPEQNEWDKYLRPGAPPRPAPGLHVRKNASTTLAKRFQFNPVSLQFTMQMTNLDHADTLAGGGNSVQTVGAASTSLELAFNREIEVYWATIGRPTTPSYFKDIGVQKDILDLYRVLIGPNQSVVGDGSSVTDLNSELFDAGIAGTQINQNPVIVSFNSQLTYYGMVMGMVYTFQKFNHRMVPTIASVTLNLDIVNIASSRAIQSKLATTAAASAVPNVTNTAPNFITRASQSIFPFS